MHVIAARCNLKIKTKKESKLLLLKYLVVLPLLLKTALILRGIE